MKKAKIDFKKIQGEQKTPKLPLQSSLTEPIEVIDVLNLTLNTLRKIELEFPTVAQRIEKNQFENTIKKIENLIKKAKEAKGEL